MCELLTPTEVEEALGAPVVAETTATIDCRYTTADGSAPEITVSIVRPVAGGVKALTATVEALADPDEATQRVTGLGDAAVLVVGAELAVLNVSVADTWLALGMRVRAGGGGALATLSALARLALRRLGPR